MDAKAFGLKQEKDKKKYVRYSLTELCDDQMFAKCHQLGSKCVKKVLSFVKSLSGLNFRYSL